MNFIVCKFKNVKYVVDVDVAILFWLLLVVDALCGFVVVSCSLKFVLGGVLAVSCCLNLFLLLFLLLVDV